MDKLSIQRIQLPDTIEDLRKFVLVGREKILAIRAEIRAIDNLKLAEEVRDQKKEEAQMLSEALLDAEVKLGDLLKQIPKQIGGDRRSEEYQRDSAVPLIKSKKEAIEDLGFSKKQAQRFEILADNKDLVEKVKEEARENDDLATRTRVIDLAMQRKKKADEKTEQEENYNKYIDDCKKISLKFNNTLYDVVLLDTDNKTLSMWAELLDDGLIKSNLDILDRALPKLLKIQNFLKEMDR